MWGSSRLDGLRHRRASTALASLSLQVVGRWSGGVGFDELLRKEVSREVVR